MEDEELLLLKEYYQLDSTFPFKRNSRGYRNFYMLLEELYNIEEKYDDTYTNYSSKHYFSLLDQFFQTMLDPSLYETLPIYYQKTTIKPDCESEVVISLDHEKRKANVEEIVLEGNDNSLHLLIGVHEYIHALLFEHYQVIGNLYYSELLSMVFEKLASHHFEKKKLDPNLYMRSLKERLINLQDSYLFDCGMEKYLLSDIYATALFDLYQEHPEPLKKDINTILKGHDTLENFLTDYKVSLENKMTTSSNHKVLKKFY